LTTRFRLDPRESQFTVHGFATGLLSFVAHSPTFAVRDFTGSVGLENGEIEGMTLELTINADSLDLLDHVSAANREEIEGRMRREVLETAIYPTIQFQSEEVSATAIAQGQYQLHINGRLSLHGVVRPHQVDPELLVFNDRLRLRGECPLRLSDYRIRPVTALGGAIRLKNELRLAFDIAGRLEGP
jgi:polyisoprenoid-binding protein YceI